VYLFRHSKFGIVWAIVMIGLAGLIVWNSTEYFWTTYTPAFLIEKLPVSRNAIWRAAFYFHVVSAGICFAAGFPLFFPALLRFRRLHLVLGYIYFNAVLWVAAPTGLIMSPFAKGGLLGALGFGVTGIAWWWTTWQGYRSVRRGEIQTHIRWMVRSFSIALSAVFFRLVQTGLGWMDVDPVSNYVASIWLSFLMSGWLAESCNSNSWLSFRWPAEEFPVRSRISNL